jgi:hypothetical protein
MESYKEIKYVPKETYDGKKDTLTVDHRELVRKETTVSVQSPSEFRKEFGRRLKNYDPDAILKFKPSNTKRIDLYHSPFNKRLTQRRI